MYDLQKRYEDGMKVLLDLKCIDLGKAIQARVKLIIEGPGWGGGGGEIWGFWGGDLSARGCLESLNYTRHIVQ